MFEKLFGRDYELHDFASDNTFASGTLIRNFCGIWNKGEKVTLSFNFESCIVQQIDDNTGKVIKQSEFWFAHPEIIGE